jgi:hypothetical protein
MIYLIHKGTRVYLRNSKTTQEDIRKVINHNSALERERERERVGGGLKVEQKIHWDTD